VVRAVQSAFANDLRFVFRNFPLTEMHPAAEPAAEFAESAAQPGKFWEVHDAIFAWSRENGPESLGLEAFESIALGLSLEPRQIERDVIAHSHLERIRADFSSGVRSGVNGTPTFFINGQRFDGSPAVKDLSAALKAALGARH
jgi:protein-disulfide isomerase